MTEKSQKYIIRVPQLPRPKLRGLGSTIFEQMLQHGNKIAHTDVETGSSETYATVLQKTIRASITMRSRGIKPDDVITICSNMSMNCFIPFYASFFVGAISANIDPKLPLSDIIHLIKLVCPKMIFVIPESLAIIEKALEETKIDTQIIIFGHTTKYFSFSEFLLPHPDETKFLPYKVTDLKDTAAIVFSSGSTGLPKGICLTHYGLSGLMYQLKYLCVFYKSTVLTYANLYWISAVAITPGCIKHGINRLICSKFDPTEVWSTIKNYKVGGLFLNSFQLLEMCKNGRPEGADTSTLNMIAYGGGPTTKEQNIHFKSCFPGTIMQNGYGQTEANGTVITFDPTDSSDLEIMSRKLDSVGKPVPGCTYKIVDTNTEEILGPNQEGELRIKSDFLMNGYYKMDSSENYDQDGFFKTGDILYYDEENIFFVVNRIKELLKYRMWHISPAKIEAILFTHPAVHSCIVIGIPHEVDGDLPMGVVILKQSAVGTIKEDELQKYVDDQVGDHQKLRAGIKFVNEFPLTVTGKVNRVQTKQLILERKL